MRVIENRGDTVVDAVECSEVIGVVDVVRGTASQGGSALTSMLDTMGGSRTRYCSKSYECGPRSRLETSLWSSRESIAATDGDACPRNLATRDNWCSQ